MRGVQVGKVASIEPRADGTAALHLAMDPTQMQLIPANVARRHRLDDGVRREVRPARCRRRIPRRSGCTPARWSDAEHVTVEINTVFQQLVSVLDKIDPAKLNETLGALAKAFSGRGEKIGQTLTDFDALLAKLEPSLPNLSARHRGRSRRWPTPTPTRSDDLIRTVNNATSISKLDRRRAAEPRRPPGQRDRSGRPRQRGHRRQPPGLDRRRCTCWCRPPTLLAKYHENIALRPGRHHPVRHSRRHCRCPAYLVSVELHARHRALPLPAGPAQGRRQEWRPDYCKELGLPNVPSEFVPPMLVADVGANPCALRQPGHPAELRWRSSSSVRAARRSAAQHRTDRAARMTRRHRHAHQVRHLRHRHGRC